MMRQHARPPATITADLHFSRLSPAGGAIAVTPQIQRIKANSPAANHGVPCGIPGQTWLVIVPLSEEIPRKPRRYARRVRARSTSVDIDIAPRVDRGQLRQSEADEPALAHRH